MFHLYLPLCRIGASEMNQPASQVVRGGRPILPVEDKKTVRFIGQDLLHDMGYEVVTAEYGTQAVEIYREQHEGMDMVIFAMIMPMVSGDEAFLG